MSVGGNSSASSNSTFISPDQLPWLENLWSQASGIANPGAAQDTASGALGFVNPFLEQGMAAMAGLADPSGQIAAQEASLSAGLGNLFRNEMMPAIARNSVAAGGLGGGRQGVAEGVAAGNIADAYTSGLGDITARANAQAAQAAGMLPGMAQNFYDMQMGGSMAGLDPLARLAAILGNPAILGQGSSTSSGFDLSLPFG